ncbi:MAG: hypothetical protein HRF45_09395 [Fimbriimonadia bacterium]|jgi:hypothetical protein
MRENAQQRGRKGDAEMIAALAIGRTARDAAALASVNEATVHRRMKDPEFMRQVSDLRDQMFRETAGSLARSTGAAVVTLVGLMKDGTPNVKLGAARTILEYSTRFAETLELAERIASVEERLAARGDRNGKG